MKKNIVLLMAVSLTLLAGCGSPVRTLEYKNGKLSMTQQGRSGSAPSTWELKEVSSATEMNTLRKSGWQFADGTMRNSVVPHLGGVDTFLMKRKVNLPTAGPTLAALPPFRPMLITTLGTNTTPDGTWRIGVSETSLDLSRSTAFSDGNGFAMSGWSTISPEGWRARAGWFVFTENESRVWAYDGDRLLFLDTETLNGNILMGTNYCNSGFPCAVPTEVFSRLSEPAQKAIQKDE